MSESSGRPSWMDGGSRVPPSTAGSRHQPQSYIKSTLPPADTSGVRTEQAATVPKSVVTGVKIIAVLMLLNTCIGIAFVLVSMIPPGGNFVTVGDYLSLWRLATTLVIGVAASSVVWKVVDAF